MDPQNLRRHRRAALSRLIAALLQHGGPVPPEPPKPRNPGKILRVQDLLKLKHYRASRFDTNGFMSAVQDYFLSADTSASLLLFPVRFAGHEGAPPQGWTPYPHTARDFRAAFGLTLSQSFRCISTPTVIIDEPYAANAVALLKMYGYIVQRRRDHGDTLYTVTVV